MDEQNQPAGPGTRTGPVVVIQRSALPRSTVTYGGGGGGGGSVKMVRVEADGEHLRVTVTEGIDDAAASKVSFVDKARLMSGWLASNLDWFATD